MISEFERALLEAIYDLPMVPNPYEAIARQLGCEVDDVMAATKRLIERGVIRRLGAVVRHTKAGLKANAMLVARVDEEAAERAATPFVESEHVSHCYLRRTAPAWSYNFYAMIHAHSRDELERIADALARSANIESYRLLYSVKEYKKTGWRLR